jgi:hypothetical protein
METVNFTYEENQALDQYCEPEIKIEKMYLGKYPVSFCKKIRSGFKLRIKFDGTEDIDSATEAAHMFFDEIQLELGDKMSDVIDKYKGIDFTTDQGFLDVKY